MESTQTPECPKLNQRAFGYYPALRAVHEHVEHHYSEPISLCDAARAAGLETKYFSTYFHQKTGVCFRDWLHAVRVRRAQDLLARQDWTITDIAFEVGFNDLRTFERAFKRLTGRTPRDFKRSARPS